MNKVYCKRINQIREEIKTLNASINDRDVTTHIHLKNRNLQMIQNIVHSH